MLGIVYRTQKQYATGQQGSAAAAAGGPGTAWGAAAMDSDSGAAGEVQEGLRQEQQAGLGAAAASADTQSTDSQHMLPGLAGWEEMSRPAVTFAELRQGLPPSCSKGLDLLWTVVQQPEAYGLGADPAAVPVAPLLAYWADPDTLQECRYSFSTEGQEQLAAILEGLQGLLQVLTQPSLQQVLGHRQQQQLLQNVYGLAEACRHVLHGRTSHGA